MVVQKVKVPISPDVNSFQFGVCALPLELAGWIYFKDDIRMWPPTSANGIYAYSPPCSFPAPQVCSKSGGFFGGIHDCLKPQDTEMYGTDQAIVSKSI